MALPKAEIAHLRREALGPQRRPPQPRRTEGLALNRLPCYRRQLRAAIQLEAEGGLWGSRCGFPERRGQKRPEEQVEGEAVRALKMATPRHGADGAVELPQQLRFLRRTAAPGAECTAARTAGRRPGRSSVPRPGGNSAQTEPADTAGCPCSLHCRSGYCYPTRTVPLPPLLRVVGWERLSMWPAGGGWAWAPSVGTPKGKPEKWVRGGLGTGWREKPLEKGEAAVPV